MNRGREEHLTNQEKTLVAMGAAMGAGCRTCADKIYEIARSLQIPGQEMLKAFHLGLDAKAEAVGTMKTKVSTLIVEDSVTSSTLPGDYPERLATLVRIAAFAAANSAPDVILEIQKAGALGATPKQIQMSISLAGMVRKNGANFSDQEISDRISDVRSDGEEMCCPAAPGRKDAPACSCS
jgi:alkylhydroperoxidase/carboxymuconolactone decarboxylase family protein YurZ